MATKDSIKKGLLEIIQNLTHNAFVHSQQIVPVITGNLRRSGEFSSIENGAQIQYKAAYSSFVERGIKAQIVAVPGYYRRDGAYVKSHTKHMKEREPRKYIENPMREAFSRLKTEFDSELRGLFKKVTKV